MSDIPRVFTNGKAIIPYVVAGDPDIEHTVKFVLALEKAGANMIQIGIPFSDPSADEVSQKEATLRGLKSGINVTHVFKIVEAIREISDVPLAFVSYLNPIFGYGYERFFKRCAECKVSAIFVIDLPFEERTELSSFAKAEGVELVCSIYPASKDRLALLARNAEGYIYFVPMKATADEVESTIAFIREITDVPIAVAFGARAPDDAIKVIGSADGLVIGSGVVKIIGEFGTASEDHIIEYIEDIRRKL